MGTEIPPPRVKPKLKAAPKVRQLYWCDFPNDAQLPEFWKRRPVIIISFKHRLHGTAIVVPCSTQAQGKDSPSVALRTTIDGKAAWAICDKPTTVAISRLIPDKSGILRMPEDEFDEILACVLSCLPKLSNTP